MLIKMQATGNDFLVLDLADAMAAGSIPPLFFKKPRAHWARVFCDRHFGLGADGFVVLEKDTVQKNLVRWDFYNADGSAAEMCGNAARCVGRHLLEQNAASTEVDFLARVGIVSVKNTGLNTFEATWPVQLGPPQPLGNGLFVNTGVPHQVITVGSLSDRDMLKKTALLERARSEFQKDGTNVTFYRSIDPTSIEAVTFERGVNDFTLSCGTGAIAAAWVHIHNTENKTCQVTVPGGNLTVRFTKDHASLAGTAFPLGRISPSQGVLE